MHRSTILRERLLALLAADFAAQGYARRQQSFIQHRPRTAFIAHINFGFDRYTADAALDVAVRHDVVEELLNADRKDLSPRQRRETATVGVELGNWLNGRQRRWYLDSEDSVVTAATEIRAWFEGEGLRFLSRFASLAEVHRTLLADGPEAKLISPIAQHRARTLEIISHILDASAA